VPSSAHAKEQVKRGRGRQQWYARPAKLFIGGKPCGFNTIGRIAGTLRAFETRTKEQGLREVAAPSDKPSRPGEPSGSKWRVPQNHTGCKGCKRVYEIKGGATGCERPKSLQIDQRECNNAGQ
jgi:hypothetical protein